MKTFLLCLVLAAASRSAMAQRFVYTPVNPAFGGNTFNYSWLQASATAQNTTVDPASLQSTATNPLTQFSNNINQQVLSQLTNRLLASQFGQGAIKEGTYTVGAYQVVVAPGGTGVVVTVTDTGTGNKTTITIPNGL
ncbi:MAG: curli assembly protein CsgF [Janthinobacterium lividum]